jgi:hypothetical protein
MENLEKMRKGSLNKSRVRRNGLIYPFGAIQIYKEHVTDHDTQYGGSMIWHESLVGFGDGNHYAAIEKGDVVIHQKKEGTVMAVLAPEEMFCVERPFIGKVSRNGMIFLADTYQTMSTREMNDELMDRALPFLENITDVCPLPFKKDDPLLQVLPIFYGQKLTVLHFTNQRHAEHTLVFTEKGEAVPFLLNWPWGEPEPVTELSRVEEYEY